MAKAKARAVVATAKETGCQIAKCTKDVHARGYCKMHYRTQLANQRAAKRPPVKLGKIKTIALPTENRMPTAAEMAARTVNLIVSFHGLGNRRKVSTSQIEVDADKELIAVSKKLIDAEELEAIQSLEGEARRYLETRALPSMLKKGIYLLPVEFVDEVTEHLKEYATRRTALVANLEKSYARLVEDARTRLKNLFNPADYPPSSYLLTAFRLDWQYVTFSTPASLEQINREIHAQEQRKAEANWREAAEAIQQLLRANMQEMVAHLVNVLSPGDDGKRKKFRDSAVGKLNEFIQTFSARNITNDTQLQALVNNAKSLLTGIDPETLRQSEDAREYVATGFNQIKTLLEPMVIVAPRRNITFEE